MSDFAPPLNQLGESGIGVAAAPSGGMGLALDGTGRIPAGVLFLGTSARRIETGTAQVTWPGGSVTATTLVVAHNLGSTPVTILLQCGGTSGVTLIPTLVAFSPTTTQFSVSANTVDAQTPAAASIASFYWLAIA